MKILGLIVCSAVAVLTSHESLKSADAVANDIQFICMKTHKASNSCHFNFRVDGANFRYVDIGCKYSKKKEELVKKVEDGSVFLAKEWKISCPEPKPAHGL